MLALEISNLTKTYSNGLQALKGINLQVEEGDFFALLGPNGAGKSTCIGIISALVNKTAGDVRIFGKSIVEDTLAAKTLLGSVPQEVNFNVFEPIREIVINQGGYYGVPRAEAEQRANQLLKELGLWNHRKAQARQLSGGMKRRLMIARALVHQPQLLILDEPTAGVDIELRRTLWEFLRKINEQGTTIILTTHYLEEAERMCRNVAIIDEGNIIQNTRMSTLLRQLHSQTFVLSLRDEIESAPQLSSFPGVRLLEPLSLEVDVDNSNSINQLMSQLDAVGITVSSMQTKVNRLEELFIKMTSKEREETLA